jgi:hypothetical protein
MHWIYSYGKLGVTLDMDIVASNGNLELFKFYHEIGKKCSIAGFEIASRNKHQNILNFMQTDEFIKNNTNMGFKQQPGTNSRHIDLLYDAI